MEAPTHDGAAGAAPAGGSLLTLPAADIGLALRFWQLLGAREVEGPSLATPADWPCHPLEAAGLPMAFHDAALLDRPALVCPRIDRRRDAPDGTPVIPAGR